MIVEVLDEEREDMWRTLDGRQHVRWWVRWCAS